MSLAQPALPWVLLSFYWYGGRNATFRATNSFLTDARTGVSLTHPNQAV